MRPFPAGEKLRKIDYPEGFDFKYPEKPQGDDVFFEGDLGPIRLWHVWEIDSERIRRRFAMHPVDPENQRELALELANRELQVLAALKDALTPLDSSGEKT